MLAHKAFNYNYAVSSSCGTYTDNSGVATIVTNLSLSHISKGRLVNINLIHDTTANDGYIGILATSGAAAQRSVKFFIIRDATTIAIYQFSGILANGEFLHIPLSAIAMLEAPGVGTFGYQIQAQTLTANTTVEVYYGKLSVAEL